MSYTEKSAELLTSDLSENVRTPGQIPTGTPWLSPTEAAEYLRISRAYIHKLLGEGALDSYKIGARTLLNKADLDRFAQKGKRRWNS